MLGQIPVGDTDRAAADKTAAAALAVYRQVVKIDPANRLADQGMGQIEGVYLDHALAADLLHD